MNIKGIAFVFCLGECFRSMDFFQPQKCILLQGREPLITVNLKTRPERSFIFSSHIQLNLKRTNAVHYNAATNSDNPDLLWLLRIFIFITLPNTIF